MFQYAALAFHEISKKHEMARPSDSDVACQPIVTTTACGRGYWDFIFVFANFLLAILFGAAAGNLARGVPLDDHGNFSMAFFTDFGVRGDVGSLGWYTVSIAVFALVLLAAHRRDLSDLENRRSGAWIEGERVDDRATTTYRHGRLRLWEPGSRRPPCFTAWLTTTCSSVIVPPTCPGGDWPKEGRLTRVAAFALKKAHLIVRNADVPRKVPQPDCRLSSSARAWVLS